MSASARVNLMAMTFALSCACILLISLADAPQTRPAKTFAPAFAAMTYYDQSCANCHGPHGAFYGPTLGNDLTDAGLIKKCRAMEVGPGNSPLAEQENLAVTAYHRSLILRTPFVSITQTGPQWSGEVTPGAKVTLDAGSQHIEATVTDWNWTADIPANLMPADVTIRADVDGKTTTLRLSDSPYSHTAALPPADQRHP